MRRHIKAFFNKSIMTEEMRIFNLVHLVFLVGMFLICFVVDYFFEDERALYLSFGMAALIIFTIYEANRTENTRKPQIILSVIVNFLYLPIMFLMFGRFVCVLPIYFVFGIIYTVLLLDIRTGLIIGIMETIFYFFILMFGFHYMKVTIEDISQYEIELRYNAALVATMVGGICAGASVRFRYLYYQREHARSEAAKAEAMDAYIAKDMFLINMSHEIRTPMNAIVGTVDLLLDQNENEHVSESVYNILNSCNALLSIMDEIMDLSKSERGELVVYNAGYDLSELLMEIVNMMTVRLIESNLDFFVDINKNIPRHLNGDASKIRQLIVNILNNAVKYTHVGHITLRVDYRVIDKNSIELIVDVEDTGEGIRQEEMGRLFKRFERANEESSNQSSIEGTGLGLAICADIVEKMGGDISVQSEYRVGSVFTIKIPQSYSSVETVAYIPAADSYSSLVFEKDEIHSEHARRIIEQLGIKCDIAHTRLDFERLMSVNKYSHVFISNERFEECDAFLGKRLISEKVVAFVNIDDNVQVRKASTILNRPINIINMAALIKNETNNYVRDIMDKGGFVCPKANILVVDDNHTNLNVASAILRKYNANILTAISGKDCLRVLKENNVDLIFLDYMMPEMNGIDTLENIRLIPGSKFAAMPVIALTANVVSGAREMFLEAGFDDFMSKPIAIDKMEKILKKYLPKELIVYQNEQEND